jgi:hypothetical protein
MELKGNEVLAQDLKLKTTRILHFEGVRWSHSSWEVW